jgi:galactokinase
MDLAISHFTERHGHPPAGVWMAPGRVNLIGEHTDYNEGYVLPFALSKAVYVAGSTRSDGTVSVTSTPFGTVELELQAPLRDDWGRYPEAAIRAMRGHGIDPPGMDLVIESDVPVGAGLSSSAALLCGTILAASQLAESTLAPEEVASLAREAETEWVGVPVGIMDQLASMCSTRDHALFLDCRSLAHQQVRLDRSDGDGRLALLIIDTGGRRRLVEGEYARRRKTCEEVAALLGVPALRDVTMEMLEANRDVLDETQLKRARHVVTENDRVLDTVGALGGEGLHAIGDLLSESHRSLATDYEVSVAALDLVVTTAEAAGALGARMTGAGFGGCVIALVTEESIDRVAESIEVAFAEQNLDRPSCFEAWPGPGAHRVA